ncbi:unnamed protein product [Lepeophtheirus salmonis]|uniref:(salmon louse) hypothetical protein n=1 Tax=Lepeophtheirus salmonis TaxID=72036 RepID=A0A7R8HAK0_LEPSM|nr:unnamed protein product [Lepeophtheirus salmonis]CAF2972418.1 unnamed protein product [Lepeophtheirus salmonis]
MASVTEERIVMTPKKKTAKSTTILMERKSVLANNNGKVHVAGGENAGIIVNKQIDSACNETSRHLFLEFRVFLRNAATNKYTQEKRVLSFWFNNQLPEKKRTGNAQEFFKRLVSPVDFPRDYVGFIKKIMKLMQNHFSSILQIEVEMTQEKEMDQLPNQPTPEEKLKEKELKKENVLKVIEESYPNSLTINDITRRFKTETTTIRYLISELVSAQLIKSVGTFVTGEEADSGASAYRRVHQNEDQVTVVKQMPRGQERSVNPSIAIITSQYHEKMAVDAVMTNKQTFMRYATVGEANVYTLGDIGDHRVVSTKITNYGKFPGCSHCVEHVFIVGVGGAVPHYTDFSKHVRLGDVVVSCPSIGSDKKFIYEYCQDVQLSNDGSAKFESRSWCPLSLGLQSIAQKLQDKWSSNYNEADWKSAFKSAMLELGDKEKSDGGWQRPPDPETDKLYMSVGEGNLIEVGHPVPLNNEEDPRSNGEPVVHLGPIAAGRKVAHNDQLRQLFANQNGILAYDSEVDAVVESIFGNRKDQYMLIRGMCDYQDGSSKSHQWKQYAALMAASVLKCIINEMPSSI